MIYDVQGNETEEQAMARVEAERLASRAEPVIEQTEVQRLAVEPGAEERPPEPSYIDPEDEAVREGWEIRDLSALDWALSRIADLEQEKAENAAIVQQAIDRLQMRLEKLNGTADRGLAFFRSHVAAYAMSHRAELLKGGKKKSRKLPHGTIQFKRTGGGYEVTDADALLAWARLQPAESEVLRIKEEPALANIKKHVETTGEEPPGLTERPESEEVRITTDGEA